MTDAPSEVLKAKAAAAQQKQPADAPENQPASAPNGPENQNKIAAARKMNLLKLIIIACICIMTYFLPYVVPDTLPLTEIQQITLVIFVGAALLWILEPMPVYATSLTIIGSLCIFISDGGLTPVMTYLKKVDPSHLMKYQTVLNSFSSPVLILFLGGFALAIASTKYKLDVNLAKILLKPFGKKPGMVTLGIMSITGIFAMFMSNTATTVMMLAMIAPVLTMVKKDDPGIKALVLAVPFAANIGGIATPVGTPPNAIALSALSGENSINFLSWMVMCFPMAVICILAAWAVLHFMFPFRSTEISITIDSRFSKDWKSIVVYVIFALTILLWMTESKHGINSNVVALVPLIGYTATGILTTSDIKRMNWDVIWLIAGGIAIGNALGATGLADKLAHIVDYSQFSGFMIIAALATIGWGLSNFISNTAAANLMIPIAMAVLVNAPDTGIQMSHAMVIMALAMSFAMTLPISTPPNALAYATGAVSNKDIMKAGGTVSVLCMLLAFAALYLIEHVF
ncbi:SLC13 family permease [Succinimonas amylolytica]|uniref:SLC13 family permease n=1 Tax=Succinimonas amylolytica TaxID=83769 RepID=UPI0023A83A7A